MGWGASKEATIHPIAAPPTVVHEDANKAATTTKRRTVPSGPGGLTTAQWEDFINRLSERIVQTQSEGKHKSRMTAVEAEGKNKDTTKSSPAVSGIIPAEAEETKNKARATAKSNPVMMEAEAVEKKKAMAASILEMLVTEVELNHNEPAKSILGMIAAEAEEKTKDTATPVHSKTVMELFSRPPNSNGHTPSQKTCVIKVHGHSVEVVSGSEELGFVYLNRKDNWNYVTINTMVSPEIEIKLLPNEHYLQGTLGQIAFTITPREGTPLNYFAVSRSDEGHLEFTMPQ